ncbi:MAG: GMC family oxidoreductase [Gammaproteobacteria bacterium]
MTRRYELNDDSVVVVIGSGAGGGTVANELAQKGIDVVCLEAGSRLTLADVVNDPPTMDARMGWHDKRIGAFLWVCKTVGGTTMRWAGISPRIQQHEFAALSIYGQVDSGTTLIDWPLTYDELSPYYARAEDKMGVSGTHDIPPSAETNNFKVLKAGAQRVGYRQITSARTAINPVARHGRPGCRQIGFCNSGCAIGAKWSTLYTEVPAAEQTGNFELRAEAMAVRINHDKTGRVSGVVYQDEHGALQEQKARAVCVAGNVVETARILLNSESSMFVDGLANSTGQVGRNYMRHTFGAALAVMPKPVNYHRGARQTGVVFDEQGHDPDRGFVGGYQLQAIAADPGSISGLIGGWGQEHTKFMQQYTHLAGLFITGEDPPEAGNRISLHPTERDAIGLPVPVIEYRNHDNTNAMRDHAIAKSRRIYESLGATEFWGGDAPVGCHNMGVARMSTDPGDGVTNRWGQAHEVPNLFVSDGSLFSSSAAANPTLTIVALAIRQADHIAERMAQKEL